MKKELLLVLIVLSIAVLSASFALKTLGIFNLSSVIPGDWEGTGEGVVMAQTPPAPRITSVTWDKKSIAPGEWVTITVSADNTGGSAEEQYISIAFPFDPPVADIQVVSYNTANVPVIYPKGYGQMHHDYGSTDHITSKYPIVEAWDTPWPSGASRTLQVKVKFPSDKTTFTFDVKTTGATGGVWKYSPTSGMIDQQNEYVYSYLILSKFQVSVTLGGTAQEVSISITNHARSPYSKTQPSMTVSSFAVTNNGGFTGTITATSLPSNIAPGSTGTIKLSVSAPSSHPLGTYNIQYKVSGTP